MMRTVHLAQVNYQYGRNTFLPYSVGRLWAYASSVPALAASYALGELFFLREAPERVVRRIASPDVVGISCYLWNWQYNLALARALRAAFPRCLIVLGGPQVPSRTDGFFTEHPYVDLLVHGEGEIAFAAILRERLSPAPEYRIAGVTAAGRDGATRHTPGAGRITDLARLPSPYLTGVFDELMALPYAFHASQETNRGCPYRCTFCDWGSAVFQKVTALCPEQVAEEIEWFGRKRISLLYNCDANFGLLPQDVAVARHLVETKRQYGFPEKFRAAYAKKSSERVYSIARTLNDAGMSKGVTISLQSLHADTLEAVERHNIAVGDVGALLERYQADGIPTYSEIILGLPGETYDSFADGIARLLEAGQHRGINVYPCISLCNSEMAVPAYVARHGLRTVRVPMLLLHGSPGHDGIEEYYDLVVETATMSHAEWRRAYLLAWAVQAFHCLGLLRELAVSLMRLRGVSYRTFYEALIAFARANPATVVGEEYRATEALLDRVMAGGSWDLVEPRFGAVTWPPEELTFLRVAAEKQRFFREIGGVLVQWLPDPDPSALWRDVLAYQYLRVVTADTPVHTEILLDHDVHGYLAGSPAASPAPRRRRVRLHMEARGAFDGDWEAYARDIVWYGRKGGDGGIVGIEVEPEPRVGRPARAPAVGQVEAP
jgi:putative methyltransferase